MCKNELSISSLINYMYLFSVYFHNVSRTEGYVKIAIKSQRKKESEKWSWYKYALNPSFSMAKIKWLLWLQVV